MSDTCCLCDENGTDQYSERCERHVHTGCLEQAYNQAQLGITNIDVLHEIIDMSRDIIQMIGPR